MGTKDSSVDFFGGSLGMILACNVVPVNDRLGLEFRICSLQLIVFLPWYSACRFDNPLFLGPSRA